MKTPGTEAEKCKACFVAQSHLDAEKLFMAHDTLILHAASIRTVLSVASNFGLGICSDVVDQAYFQSKEMLTWSIAIKPHATDLETIDILADEFFKLEKPLYWLCDAEDYWRRTISNPIKTKWERSPHSQTHLLILGLSKGILLLFWKGAWTTGILLGPKILKNSPSGTSGS